MQNLLTLWLALNMRRRIVVIGATVAMFLAVIAVSRVAAVPGMALLYSGLGSSAAGEVVAALDQRGMAYEIRGDAILVDADQRDMLRMTLAAEGLPSNSGSGYELLDQISGFGTTSQMFDAAYARAKEGELARTILANPMIRAARVHIALSPVQPFRRDVHPTASVTVTTASGNLSADQAQALRHLVAAAVADMRPEDVAVIDSVGGYIPSGADGTLALASTDARASEIRGNVERLLAARVGPGRAVVEVTVDLITESESITERTFDPQGRVAISSETEQKTGSNTEGNGDVSVASNLPDGDAAAGGGQSQTSESTERVNYEVSETQREVIRAPGAIRKLSVAVLVDGQTSVAEDGTVTLQPRPEEELAVLRDLVASAVGLDEARGDVLTLRSLSFQPMAEAGTLAEAGMLSSFGPIDTMALLQIGILAFVALVLGLFVVRPILTSQPRSPLELFPEAQPLALTGGSEAAPRVLNGEIDDGYDLPVMAVNARDGIDDLPIDPVLRLRRLIEQRQAESVEILRGWMEVEEERT